MSRVIADSLTSWGRGYFYFGMVMAGCMALFFLAAGTLTLVRARHAPAGAPRRKEMLSGAGWVAAAVFAAAVVAFNVLVAKRHKGYATASGWLMLASPWL
jgi:hypothetical protein